MKTKPLISSLLLSCLVALPLQAAPMQSQQNPRTGMLSWKVEAEGFSLELIQLLPDVIRAMYESRGIPKAMTEGVVKYCVFGSVAINTSDKQVAYRVADWRYITADGRRHRLKTKSEWVEEWRRMGVPYGWSILPDDQVFEAGDWSQGFTTVGLKPNDIFDLEFSWQVDGKSHTGLFKGIRCAPEKSPLE